MAALVDTSKNSISSARLRSQRWLALLGLALFGAVLYYAGPEAWPQILQADPRYLLLAFGVNILLMVSSAIRWGLLTNAAIGRKVCPYLNYFYYLVLGRVSGLFVSFNGGDYVVRPLALRATNSLSTGRMLYALILDRIFDLLLALVFLGPTLFFLLGQISLNTYLLSVLLALAILGLFWRFYDRLLPIVLQFCSSKGQRLLKRVKKVGQWLDLLASGEGLIGHKIIQEAYGMTIVRFALLTLYHYLVSRSLGLSFSVLEFWMVIPIVQLGLLVAFTPGAFGILELGWLGALTLLGANQLEVNAFVVGQRVFFLIFTLLIGLLVSPMMFISRRNKANLH